MAIQKRWKCATCGQWHDELPLDYAFRYPDYFFGVPEPERKERTWVHPEENPDFCHIDLADFFIRGVLKIPVQGLEDYFAWGMWTTLSRPNFDRVLASWRSADPPACEPLFGWVSNSIPIYPETLSLKANIIVQRDTRPFIELQPTDHPLAVEQRDGISVSRWHAILHELGAV